MDVFNDKLVDNIACFYYQPDTTAFTYRICSGHYVLQYTICPAVLLGESDSVTVSYSYGDLEHFTVLKSMVPLEGKVKEFMNAIKENCLRMNEEELKRLGVEFGI